MSNSYFRLALAAALALPSVLALAQPVAPAANRYALRLAVGDVLPPANAAAWLARPAAPAPADAWQGRLYRVLQFDHILTEAQQQRLRRAGVTLFDYLPNYAYTVSLPAGLAPARLAGLGLRSIAPVPGPWKLAGVLAQGTVPDHARRGAGRLEIVLHYYPALAPAEAVAALSAAGYEAAGHDEFSHQLRVVLPETALPALLAQPWVSAAEAAPAPGVPENFRGRTDHRANVLATDYGAGRHYDGRGVTVGHGDDGAIGPHIDFTGRVDISTAGPTQGDHGDHVAGIIMGAGNLDPRVRGQAVGAFNFYQSYPNNWTQAPANYASATRRVRVTNSSYGDGNNAGYTANTRTVDLQMRQLPNLMHVFSSGNSGTSNFNYGAGAGWGNITGGHKMGKNVLTVGNVEYTDALAPSSSRGPASDGRIKPDVCAVGTNVTSTISNNQYDVYTGTSMACPGVAGVSAQLVGAYRALNGGAEMPAALLKAVLQNTAEDLGNAGPDFRFGYGRINGLRAVRALEGRTYFRDTLAQGQSITLTVPFVAGKRQLRVLLHWSDLAAAANARPALVNNLDLTGGPAGSPATLQPWVLDHRPTVAQLNALAVPGRDSLNNTEQITIENPASPAGYTFTISGRAVPLGRQGFWLTYSYIDNGVELTYPLGGEGVVPGENEVVRWDAPDNAVPFALDYSLDGGTTWVVLASTVPGTARYYNWTVPAAAPSGQVRVRVRRGADSSASPANLTLAPLPTAPRIDYVCANELRLSWTVAAGATSYTVYRLGAMYMDSVTTVTTTQAVLPLPATGSNWFAVCSRGPAGLRSRRTLAFFQPAGLRNCPGVPLASFAATPGTTCVSGLVQLGDSSQNVPTAWLWAISPAAGVSFVGGTSATSQNPRLNFATPGTYTVSLTSTNSFGTNTTTRPIVVTNGAALAFGQDFRGLTTATFPPVDWALAGSRSRFAWQLSANPVTGPDGTSRRLPVALNYDNNARGTEYYLLTPPLNLGGSLRPEARFWVAYQPYNGTDNDGLRLDISADCGQTFQPTGYLKDGLTLATVPSFNTQRFVPAAAAQWRQETVDLTPFLVPGAPATQPRTVLLRFANINQYGNNLYLTDVAVAERIITGTAKNALFAPALLAHPVPFGAGLTVEIAAAPQAGPATLTLLDALGRTALARPLTLRPTAQTVVFDTDKLAAGVYILQLTAADGGTRQVRVTK